MAPNLLPGLSSRARQLAENSWEALEQVVQCADEMHMRRGQSDNCAASVLTEVAGFEALRQELECPPNPVDALATIGEACRGAEEQIQESRTKAQVWQREVRRSAQARDAKTLDEMVRKRDLQNAQHSRELISALSNVVWTVEPPGNKRKDSILAALEGRQPDALVRAKQATTDWEASAVAQEEGLARALEAATECVVRYADTHGGDKAMGRSEGELPDAAEDTNLARVALAAYSSWAGRVGTDAAEQQTDKVLEEMEQAATHSFGSIFKSRARRSMFQGSARRDQAHTGAVKAAMLRYGEALDAEFEAQAQDFLEDMPCHLLISAGRQCMARRTRERAAKAHVRAVVWDIAKELEMVQESLDGAWRKRRDAAVEEFVAASKSLKKALRNLNRAKQDIEEFIEDAEGTESEAPPGQLGQLEAHVAAGDAEVRAQRSRVKLALSELAAVEPEFPEVMVHLEKALPRELLSVWRPDCALEDMFAAREKITEEGRHAVWRCSDGQGGEEFAVKEFRLADLRASLREAALLTRMRHPAIVSVVAVFQDTSKGSVMLQMPYGTSPTFYPHGPVDVWVKNSAPG
ncbi:hypothetical protein T484DRAFT_1810165 [Baffinella frigidus]|nr:hypothetical protein T484DRAFT_1810165 [Cryptophyta sp. CCMP2293]